LGVDILSVDILGIDILGVDNFGKNPIHTHMLWYIGVIFLCYLCLF